MSRPISEAYLEGQRKMSAKSGSGLPRSSRKIETLESEKALLKKSIRDYAKAIYKTFEFTHLEVPIDLD